MATSYLWLFMVLLFDGFHLLIHKVLDFRHYWLEYPLDVFAVR